MPVKEILAVLAIGMNVISSAPYVAGICKKKTKPHMFSWIIWGIVCATGAAVQFAEGGGAGSWPFMANALYCFGIAVASIWIGTKDIKRSDWAVLCLALSAVPLWVMTKTPIWSVLIVIMIDGAAYIPTVRKSWNKPHEESALSWGLSTIVFALTIAALENYSLATYLYPAIFIVINVALVVFLLARRKILKVSEAFPTGQAVVNHPVSADNS